MTGPPGRRRPGHWQPRLAAPAAWLCQATEIQRSGRARKRFLVEGRRTKEEQREGTDNLGEEMKEEGGGGSQWAR